jgi:hypothetical protein
MPLHHSLPGIDEAERRSPPAGPLLGQSSPHPRRNGAQSRRLDPSLTGARWAALDWAKASQRPACGAAWGLLRLGVRFPRGCDGSATGAHEHRESSPTIEIGLRSQAVHQPVLVARRCASAPTCGPMTTREPGTAVGASERHVLASRHPPRWTRCSMISRRALPPLRRRSSATLSSAKVRASFAP